MNVVSFIEWAFGLAFWLAGVLLKLALGMLLWICGLLQKHIYFPVRDRIRWQLEERKIRRALCRTWKLRMPYRAVPEIMGPVLDDLVRFASDAPSDMPVALSLTTSRPKQCRWAADGSVSDMYLTLRQLLIDALTDLSNQVGVAERIHMTLTVRLGQRCRPSGQL